PRYGHREPGLTPESRGAPEHRPLRHSTQVADVAAHDDRFGTLRSRGACRFGIVDVDDHRDPVTFRYRQAEPALASHGLKYLLTDRVPDGLELEERGDLPWALRVGVTAYDALHVVGRRALELGRGPVGPRDVEGVDVHVRGEPRRQLSAITGEEIDRPAQNVRRGERLSQLDGRQRVRLRGDSDHGVPTGQGREDARNESEQRRLVGR